jgi:lipoprotein-anchoring transpeptidase ErfK/SrfK
MKTFNTLTILLSLCAAIGFSSCSNTTVGGIGAYQAYDRPTKLPSNPSAVKVKVSLSKQRVYVMEGNEILLAMPVSVGKPSSPTPKGTFRIYNKEAKRRAITHGYAKIGSQIRSTYLSKKPAGAQFRGTPMPYWCEFKPAYGFHTGWVKHTPATHGCIRMHENLAPKFFKLVSNGTPVSIANSQPQDSQLADMPLPPDAGPLPDYDTYRMYWEGGYFTRHKTPEYN